MTDRGGSAPAAGVDEIIERIRKEAAARKGRARSGNGGAADRHRLRALIADAEHVSDAGAAVSPMHRFSGVRRFLALQTGKVVVFLASFITDRQRQFNQKVTQALGELATGLERAGGRGSRSRSGKGGCDDLSLLEGSLEEQGRRLTLLEERLDSCSRRVLDLGASRGNPPNLSNGPDSAGIPASASPDSPAGAPGGAGHDRGPK